MPYVQPPSSTLPTQDPATNLQVKILAGAVPPQGPLDYISPQAAIAAGLDQTVVYSAWSAAVNQFPNPQAAMDAGVPPGVVTELWNGGPVPAPPDNTKTILLVAGAIFAFLALAGGKREAA